MSAYYYVSPRAISSASATTEAAGYPASNLLNTDILRPWRSNGVGAHNIDIDLGATGLLQGILLQATNIQTCNVYVGASNPANVLVGTMTCAVEENGRRKGLIYNSALSLYRYIRINALSTSPSSQPYFQIGAVHVFAARSTDQIAPLQGARLRRTYPAFQADLPNGAQVSARTGPTRTILTMPVSKNLKDAPASAYFPTWPLFEHSARGDLDPTFGSGITGGAIAIDFNNPNRRELVWPMRMQTREITANMSRPFQDQVEYEFREIV